MVDIILKEDIPTGILPNHTYPRIISRSKPYRFRNVPMIYLS